MSGWIYFVLRPCSTESGNLVEIEQEAQVAKSDKNRGKQWTSSEVKELRKLAKENTPTRVISLKMGRPEGGVRAKASENNVSLKPTNQSPYNRRKK